VGLIARVFEREGLPTVTLSSALDVSERVKAPRTAFLNFPLGSQVGPPNEPELQRQILRRSLQLIGSVREAGEIVELPFEWPDADWRRQVIETYRHDAATLDGQRRESEYEDGRNFAEQECVDVCGFV